MDVDCTKFYFYLLKHKILIFSKTRSVDCPKSSDVYDCTEPWKPRDVDCKGGSVYLT
jgi:hypothetical protein